ncbi:MAG TPA: methylene-tetrahydromethanopterin dehydrogenase N-terminal domain-containing protein [Azospirillaceae bacterium]|nr:methylene-tetrahydromethanopterin dehydrogenase N-terminal domain-containing protein [Azospirillaceae bacterium]
MEGPYILHMITSHRTVSPFDVTVAADAGYQLVEPYTGVTLEDVPALTQAAILSRPTELVRRTALFIGGPDAALALDMLEAARKAMGRQPVISAMVDPSGAFTEAAALVALVEHHLARVFDTDLNGRIVQIFGADGVTGGVAGVLAAEAGARVTLVSQRGIAAVSGKATGFRRRFGVELLAADAPDDRIKNALLNDGEVVMNCSSATMPVLSTANLAHAKRLMVAIDLNPAPAGGVEGIRSNDNGCPLAGTPGIAIGAEVANALRLTVLRTLLGMLRSAVEPVFLDFHDALRIARDALKTA